jgi:hypothetical protein
LAVLLPGFLKDVLRCDDVCGFEEGSKNPDLSTSTKDVLKHSSWTNEWFALGLPKEEQSRTRGNGGRGEAVVWRMSLPMAESERYLS